MNVGSCGCPASVYVEHSLRQVSQGLLFWLFKAAFKVSSAISWWFRSSYGTDFDKSEIASPVSGGHNYPDPQEDPTSRAL